MYVGDHVQDFICMLPIDVGLLLCWCHLDQNRASTSTLVSYKFLTLVDL